MMNNLVNTDISESILLIPMLFNNEEELDYFPVSKCYIADSKNIAIEVPKLIAARATNTSMNRAFDNISITMAIAQRLDYSFVSKYRGDNNLPIFEFRVPDVFTYDFECIYSKQYDQISDQYIDRLIRFYGPSVISNNVCNKYFNRRYKVCRCKIIFETITAEDV